MMGDPEAQAVLQASMAETQRRAARDANDLTLAREKQQIDVALNTENNLTKERMQAVDVTVDELKLRDEQQETAMKLQEAAQRNIGR
jgi:hypothetical protein